MQKFIMCDTCNDEYNDVNDKRFFSQTNSCTECGIVLNIHDNAATFINNNTEQVLLHIQNFLQQGKIIAVKGIGGYLLKFRT